ncbi:hypothetical protein [Niabella ginsengisoli]
MPTSAISKNSSLIQNPGY